VRLKVGSVEYGSDFGVVSFGNGWLHYQGRTTEFHFDSGSTKTRFLTTVNGKTGFEIRFFGPDFNGTCTIYPVTVDAQVSSRAPIAMVWQFSEWRETPFHGRPLLPPRRAQAECVSISRLQSRKFVLIGLITFAFAAIAGALSWLNRGSGHFLALPFLFFAAISYWRAARWGMAHRLLTRMADQDRPAKELDGELRRVRWAMFFRPRHWLT
jgi:hypothetical protein